MDTGATYEFSIDSVISIDAEIGTDPIDLYRDITNKLVGQALNNQLLINFDTTYDADTGDYSTDWEKDTNLARDFRVVAPKVLLEPVSLDKDDLIKLKEELQEELALCISGYVGFLTHPIRERLKKDLCQRISKRIEDSHDI